MAVFVTSSPEETLALGKRIAQSLLGNEVIAYFGGLGVGKTTLTRGIAEGLRCAEDVTSPTFAIVNEYSGKYSVYHFDMYRISGLDDLYSTGFFDFLGMGVIIIEWSENIEDALPDDTIRIYISKGSTDDERTFRITEDICP